MVQEMVSIITPIYNGAAFVEETIQSVFAQTYQNYEWIVVDDGSKDDSYSILMKYAEQNSRMQVIQQENAGSAAARNAGIRMAKGQYIALLDADDLWDPEFLEKQIIFMKKHHTRCVYGSYRMINENSEVIKKPVICRSIITRKDMMIKNEIGCLTGLYDCSKHGKVYLDESLKSIRDDYAYWIEIVTLSERAYGNKEVLASYRVSENSVTGNKKKLIRKQYGFYRKYLKLGVLVSLRNTFLWGLSGICKFS